MMQKTSARVGIRVAVFLVILTIFSGIASGQDVEGGQSGGATNAAADAPIVPTLPEPVLGGESGGGRVVIPTRPSRTMGENSAFEDVTPEEVQNVPVDNSVQPIIEFNDAPFANVMRLLSRQAGISFLEPNLAEEPALTITLRDTTPLEAFNTIAEFRGFRVRTRDGVYTLSRPDLAGPEALLVKKYRLDHLDPTWVLQEIANLLGITLTAPAENINSLPAPQQSDIGGGGSGGQSDNVGGGIPTQPRWLPSLPFDSPASAGGLRAEFAGEATMPSAVWVDRRDNAIVVRASRDEHAMVEEYIAENDAPEPQIVIDCRIIELTEGDDSDIGMDWNKAFGPGGGLQFSLDPSLRTAPSGMFDWGSAFEFFFFPFGSVVNWPRAEATFRAWEKDNKAHAISTPRVVTKSGVPVSIVSVIQDPIQTYAAPTGTTGDVNQNSLASGTETFSYGVTMDVVPRLLADNFVDLNINPIVSQKIGEKPVGAGATEQNIPIISKRSATTTVRVKSGQTVVIGGLMSLNDKTIETGVPPFDRIPLIGNILWGNKKREKTRTNLIIFVTPRVVPADRAIAASMGPQERAAYNQSMQLDPPYKSVPVKKDGGEVFNPPVETIPQKEYSRESGTERGETSSGKAKKFRWPWQKKPQASGSSQ
jgi:hypothetical protein